MLIKPVKPILILILCLCSAICNADQRSHSDSWKNFYSLSFSGSGTESARYAKQMGYEYLGVVQWRNPNQYANNSVYSGFKFILTDPHIQILRPGFSNSPQTGADLITIDTALGTSPYTAAELDFIESYYPHGSTTTAFPAKLATGWWSSSTDFNIVWDYQQQRVIDFVVDNIVAMAHRYQSENTMFSYAGYAIDVSTLSRDFRIWDGGDNTAVTVSYWTGTNSALLHGTITHEYATIEDGTAAFYKQLNNKLKNEYGNHVKFIHEPWVLYNSTPNAYNVYSETIYHIRNRSDVLQLIPDMLLQESGASGIADFVDNTNNFNTINVPFQKSQACSSQTKQGDLVNDRLIAAKAAINGAWYNWWGKLYAAGGTMPNWGTQIGDVWPRLKLSRCIPSWCNLTNTGTQNTSWNGNTFTATNTVYSGDAPHAYMGTYTMYATHWKRPTEKFVVKMGTDTHLYEPVVIGTGLYVKDIYSINEYFEPIADVKSTQWTKTGNSWQINNGIVTGTLTDGGVGYIFKVLPEGGYTN